MSEQSMCRLAVISLEQHECWHWAIVVRKIRFPTTCWYWVGLGGWTPSFGLSIEFKRSINNLMIGNYCLVKNILCIFQSRDCVARWGISNLNAKSITRRPHVFHVKLFTQKCLGSSNSNLIITHNDLIINSEGERWCASQYRLSYIVMLLSSPSSLFLWTVVLIWDCMDQLVEMGCWGSDLIPYLSQLHFKILFWPHLVCSISNLGL